jgi:hypothetical protein
MLSSSNTVTFSNLVLNISANLILEVIFGGKYLMRSPMEDVIFRGETMRFWFTHQFQCDVTFSDL